MLDPLMIPRMQLAMMEGWMNMAMHMLTAYGKLWQHQAELLHHPLGHRWHNVPPQGFNFLDHYGRRLHDVDVEHMR